MIIISPAKKQITDKTKEPWSKPKHLEQSRALLSELVLLSPEELKKTLKVSDDLASLNHQRHQRLHQHQFDENLAIPAAYMYAGDVYQYLDVRTLNDDQLQFMQKKLRIISALYGLLSPMDGIWPYRLEMVHQLCHYGSLPAYWCESVTQDLHTNGDQYLFNLASQAYSQSIDQKAIKGWVDLVFQDKNKDGRYQVIAVKAKRMRGLLLRYMIEHQVEQPQDLMAFNLQGYQLDEAESTPACLVFRSK